MMRAYPIAGMSGFRGQSEVIIFTFCGTCNTIVFGRDVSQCTRCGSAALERLGLMEIASRLRRQCVGCGSAVGRHTDTRS